MIEVTVENTSNVALSGFNADASETISLSNAAIVGGVVIGANVVADGIKKGAGAIYDSFSKDKK